MKSLRISMMLLKNRIALPARYLKVLLLLAVAGGTTAYLAAVFPALDYYFTSAYQEAQFDAVAVIRGTDVSASDFSAALPGLELVPLVKTDGELRRSSSWGATDVWAIRTADVDRVSSTYFSDAAVERGKLTVRTVGVGGATAARLGLRLGDRVAVRLHGIRIGPDPEGAGPRIAATWRPMDGVDGVLIPLPLQQFEAVAKEARETHIFVASDGPITPGEEALLSMLSEKGNGVLLTPEQGRDTARARFKRTLGRQFSYASVLLALALYLTFVWRSASGMFAERSKDLAILLSIGAHPRNLATMAASEHALLSLISLCLGGLVARLILWKVNKLYLPTESVAVLGFAMFGLVALSALVTGVLWRIRTKRLSVAELLAAPVRL